MSSSRCYPEKAPEVSELLDVLSNTIRREVVHYFENFASDETASLDVITTHLEERIPSAEQTELRPALHHTHLPKLEESGWIEYDDRSNTIRYHGHERPQELLGELIDVFDD